MPSLHGWSLIRCLLLEVRHYKMQQNKGGKVQLLHWGNLLCLFPSFLGSITITPQDSRWVGAWWLGFLIGGATSFLSAIPFCFLPRSLKKPEGAKKDKTSHSLLESMGAVRNKLSPEKTKPRKWSLMLKGKCFSCCINVKSSRHNTHRKCSSSAKYFASPALRDELGTCP